MKRGIFSAVLGILVVSAISARACTSWVLRPEVTESGRMIVQKILDNPYSTLDADIRIAPNGWRWIRIGRLNGPSMAMNEKGVAITANCGERNGDEPSRKGRQTFYSFELLWHVIRNCATAEEGVEELKHIGRNRLFRMPGKQVVKYGSILMVADAKRAFVVEIGDGYCEAVEIANGIHVVANAWRIPGGEAVSVHNGQDIRGNRAREVCAVKALQANQVDGKYTVRGCFDASRRIRGPKYVDRYPFVPGKASNMSLMTTCFEIDPEFPAYLSCAYVALGPQRHTVYLPVPMAVRQLPDKMRDGRWAQMAFTHQEAFGPEHGDLQKFTELEDKFLKEFNAERGRARQLLQAGKTDEAVKLLNDTFERQYAEADAALTALDETARQKSAQAGKANGEQTTQNIKK
ncbi:MAG: hypothetical protein J6Y54_07710 [Lentisphaeria bacterium]|nr:hypothetical protein [Lentisphaeria bacterium]